MCSREGRGLVRGYREKDTNGCKRDRDLAFSFKAYGSSSVQSGRPTEHASRPQGERDAEHRKRDTVSTAQTVLPDTGEG